MSYLLLALLELRIVFVCRPPITRDPYIITLHDILPLDVTFVI